ncbi:MAG: AmmeMemoRadiSam system protein B [Methanobacteriaceae archaeon]|jgi:AmmeMemoRadiSam system protein B|nr:AmmeMemoRadiSam system protein B [Candidatus Methanorudis spinitermitis]
MIRKPAVSGLFYDSDPEDLKKTIENCFKHELGPGKIPTLAKSKKNQSKDGKIYGAIAPHAGYVYSGPVAAHAYYQLVENGFPETFIILSPNHTGIGTGVSIFNEGSWDTPLGTIKIDEEFSQELIKTSEIIDPDFRAHLKEHSCEVHLPFLQYFSNDFKIVPIVMWMQDITSSEEIAEGIVKVAKSLNTSISIIASTDLTHYAPQEIASKQDDLILDKISKMDEKELLKDIENFNISMCGYGPTIATIKATREFGANKCDILKYATSGNISGDLSSVVGYCSGIFI